MSWLAMCHFKQLVVTIKLLSTCKQSLLAINYIYRLCKCFYTWWLTAKDVSKITYNVSSGPLNPAAAAATTTINQSALQDSL